MTREQQPPHDDAIEREWVLQEQALRAERLGLDPRGDAKLQRYRAVAHALRQPLDENLPSDFATQMAAQVRQRRTTDMRFELWLSGVLVGVLGAAMLSLLIVFGHAWLELGHTAMITHGLSSPWLFALMACVVLPAVLGKATPSNTRGLG
jgi:anti-sigma factor RsiW